MQFFAFCLAGELDAARSLAKSRYANVGRPHTPAATLEWLQARYGVLPSLLASNLAGRQPPMLARTGAPP